MSGDESTYIIGWACSNCKWTPDNRIILYDDLYMEGCCGGGCATIMKYCPNCGVKTLPIDKEEAER